VNRVLVGLSALLLSITGVPSRAIPPPPPDDVRVVKVLDATTIVVTPYGDPFTVRLACIHTPSLHQGSAGRAANAALESLLQPGTWVTLSNRSKAADRVDLAEIIPVGSTVPINLSLVQAGMAAMDRKASSPCNLAAYREAEMNAKSKKLGIWGAAFGTRLIPTMPLN
jgi:endonuclease YncB( thermonuclease family)